MPPELVPEVLKYGLAGVVMVVLAIAYWKKDQQVAHLQALRIEDHKEHAKDNLRNAELLVLSNKQSELRDEAARTRSAAIEKIDESTRTIAVVLSGVVEKQDRILANIERR